jgi:hypothetical protein
MQPLAGSHTIYMLLVGVHCGLFFHSILSLFFPWFNCDESLTWRDLNSNAGRFVLFFFYLCFVRRIAFACLVVCRCGMACSDEDHGRSRRPGAEDQGWSHRSSTRWSDGREVG